MFEKYFFDIPVFSCELNEFSEAKEKKKIKTAQLIASGAKMNLLHMELAERSVAADFSCYRYGEMIGMIRLYSVPRQIRADVYFVTNRRVVVGQKNRMWAYYGKLFEFAIHDNDSNTDIYNRITDRIRSNVNIDYFRNRYIDLEAFNHSGIYINYLELVS